MQQRHPGFRILEHPADLGIEAHGSTLQEAFVSAAEGMMSVIVDLTTVDARETRTVEIGAGDPAQLLVRWLTEVLYYYDGRQFISKEFTMTTFEPTRLRATLAGEQVSLPKHRTLLDVKAVTYHQIEVTMDEDGARVRVFLDI